MKFCDVGLLLSKIYEDVGRRLRKGQQRLYGLLGCLLLVMRGDAPIIRVTLKGCVPFTPMPYEPTLEVAVLPMKGVGEEEVPR
jgi:hypothetical protein